MATLKMPPSLCLVPARGSDAGTLNLSSVYFLSSIYGSTCNPAYLHMEAEKKKQAEQIAHFMQDRKERRGEEG